MTSVREGAREDGALLPGLLVGTLHLAGIWAIAAVQPTFQLLESGEAFVSFRWTGWEIVLFSVALIVIPPLILALLEAAALMRSQSFRWRVHLLFVALMMGVFAGFVIRSVDDAAPTVVFVLVLPFGVLSAVAYNRMAALRSFFSVLAIAPVAILLLFLLNSPVRDLVRPQAPPEISSVDEPNETPVVLIVLDEFPLLSLVNRDGAIDERSYPGFATLAKTSTWYPRATTVADFTDAAVPAIVGGATPNDPKPPSWRTFPNTIFNVVRDSHTLHANEIFTLCQPAACDVESNEQEGGKVVDALRAFARVTSSAFAPRAMVDLLPHPSRGVGDPLDGLDDLAEKLTPGGSPPFVYIHLLLPHAPWVYLPSGRQTIRTRSCCVEDVLPQFDPSAPELGIATSRPNPLTENEHLTAAVQQDHLLQVQYVDRLLADAVVEMKRSGTFDDALVVVTGDHGVSFTPGADVRRLTEANAPEILGVPLFVKYPNQRRGDVDRRHVKNFDVAPTIARTLGTDLPWDEDAIPLMNPAADRSVISAYRSAEEDSIELDADEYDRRFDALALRNDRIFGPGEVGLQAFAFGPTQELIGDGVSKAPIRTGVSATVFASQLYEEVDLTADHLPVRVSGELSGEGAATVKAVAVAVHDRVASTAWTYESSSGAISFDSVIPPRALRLGENDVEILAIESADQGLVRIESAE